ncbi:Hsp20/alpha crystallin family protein [Peribacillus cavernae]|uniref:Hsp20/alpha crystallin family protein n=1 Tax=Peribacillus cavernae TaxID=1674310 RepID=A0A3S0WCQ9_9BACI|nr:Hsp20/alpha crystallin family protein [Peribacillus cavernae]MDQ0217926.1 HSP20 family molecular chaperone IbpA [Peribacillus cavernae]RUQ32578.1 Hsp20/alpha crystallin family protein [Peribacillus cavernae]
MFPWNMLFPFQKNDSNNIKNMQPDEIQSFIDQLFSQVIPGNMQQMMEQHQSGAPFQSAQQNVQGNKANQYPLNAEIFETHSEVYVRIPIQSPEMVKQAKIYHTSNQSIIEGIPAPEDKHVFTLPAIVKKKGASARYKEKTLEIKLLKNFDFQYSQIDVSEV